ncbi:MAG: hypothetical protein RQ833_08430 [Sphingomonadaceae bacterium]|nr:hypothetical protein [Sphingomonadaceae bacterium]
MATAAAPLSEAGVAAGIERLNRGSAKLEAEARKLRAQTDTLTARQFKLTAGQIEPSAQQTTLARDTMPAPWLIVVQGLFPGAALLAAGLALAKYLLER